MAGLSECVPVTAQALHTCEFLRRSHVIEVEV